MLLSWTTWVSEDASASRGRDLLVTGTDTGVGKTVVAAALILALRESGLRAVGFKPVESGIGDGEPADSEVLRAASGVDEPLARPLLRLAEPLAPAVAAERAGKALDPAAVEERLRALRSRADAVIVEGAGGLLVPLAWGYTALDLAQRMGLAVVLVARAGLGTINHTLLTIDAMRSRDVAVHAVVLNGRGTPPDLAESTNPDALARLLPDVPLLQLPRQAAGLDTLEVAQAATTSLRPLLPLRSRR
jgi:dethiobiotin synthetase